MAPDAAGRGVTLVELLVVVLILSIVLGLGVPGYRQYVMRANRTDATAALLRIAAAQERFYLQQGRYAGAGEMAAAPPAGLGIAATERGYYNLEVDAPDPAVGFTATATAVGGQLDDDHCRSFSVNEAGQRSALDDGGAPNLEACWR